MGKYMRKFRGAMGEEVAAVEVTQVVGVRTRSRSASASASAAAASGAIAKVRALKTTRKMLPPAPATATPPAGDPALGTQGNGGSCYLQLRSRMLFMAPPPAPAPWAEAAGACQGAVLAAGLSRCSSTASSVDAAAQDRSLACRSDVAEAGGERTPEGSASNSESGRDGERRETTPSSRLPREVSDLETDLAGQKRGRPLLSATTTVQEASRARMREAAEIEEFFAEAEEAEAKRFAAKYNFDVVRGVPFDAGRFEWIPVVSR